MSSRNEWMHLLGPIRERYHLLDDETRDFLRNFAQNAPTALRSIVEETGDIESLIVEPYDRFTETQHQATETVTNKIKSLNHQKSLEIIETVRNPVHLLDENLFVLVTSLIQTCRAQVAPDIDVIGLADLAFGEYHLFSSGTLLFLAGDGVEKSSAQSQARHLETTLAEVTETDFKANLNVLSLSNQGVTSYSDFLQFELNEMDMKTRLKLHSSVLIDGREPAVEVVRKAAYALPLTPDRLQELVLIRQIEAELVPKKHLSRNMQVGIGSLAEIEWLVCLYELRFPDVFTKAQPISVESRIHNLEKAKMINLFECEVLIEARQYLIQLSNHLYFLGYDSETLPENPDKLDRLAAIYNVSGGNEFLRQHENKRDAIHGIYQEGLERLRV